jgi:hypothetical protein
MRATMTAYILHTGGVPRCMGERVPPLSCALHRRLRVTTRGDMPRTTRLKTWLAATYKSVPSLIVAVGGYFRESTARQWIKGISEPGAASLAALYESGLNVHWYLSGEGPMYSETPRGRAFARLTEDSGCELMTTALAGEPVTEDMMTEINRAIEDVLRRYG